MATAAGAVVAATRRRLIEHFMAANAVDPERAIAYTPRRFVDRRIFDRFVRKGVIRSADQDYYLDLPTYISDRKAMKKRIATILGAAAAIGAAVATIGIMS